MRTFLFMLSIVLYATAARAGDNTFIIRQQICDSGSDTLCHTWSSTSPGSGGTPSEPGTAPSGYAVAFLPAIITTANANAAAFHFINAETEATYHFSIDDSSPATPAVTGSGSITAEDMTISGVNLTGLADGTLTLSATLTANGLTGAPATASIEKDTSGPVITSLSPTDDATDAWTTSSLNIAYAEPIQRGSGSISIHTDSGTLFETINITSSQVSISGNGSTITPSASFQEHTSYYITMDAGAFTDTAGNPAAAISDATAWNFTTAGSPLPIQKIASQGARKFKSFVVDGTTYMLLANQYNNSTYNLNSRLFRFDPANPDDSKLVPLQDIPSLGAVSWETFSISGETYVLIANQYINSTYNLNSVLYRFVPGNPDSSKLVAIQSIPTHGATDWESFTVGGNTYIALANHRDSSSNTNLNSVLYLFKPGNPDNNKMVAIQNIPTNGATDWKAFNINGTTYLMVANNYGTSYNTNSYLYRFEPAGVPENSRLVSLESVPTEGPMNIDTFTYQGTTYIIIANFAFTNAPAKMYRFDPARTEGSQLVFVQDLPTGGLFDVETFSINGFMYVATASFTNYITQIFRFLPEEPIGSQMKEIYNFAGFAPSSCDYFEIDGEHYLAVTNHKNGSQYNVDSDLYRFQP